MSLWLTTLSALAAPNIDDPVKTGASSPSDAALVVGIEDYFLLPDVPHADRDADAFRSFLRYTRGVPEARLRMLGKGANREQILTAMTELAPTVGSDGVLWVYFAGHGAADPTSGERVLLGADTQADQATFQARAVKMSELEDLAASSKGKSVFVLDTCYSGRTRDGGDLVEGKRFAVPSYAVAPKAKVVEWTAAGPGEWSGPLASAEHGAFTYAVLGALRGWADGHVSGQPDGKVTIDEAHAYVTDALRSLDITDQHPSVTGDVSMVVSTATEAAPDLRDDDAPSGTSSGGTVMQGDPTQPGQLSVQTSSLVMFVLDGTPLQPACEGCMKVDAYGLSAGSHRLEVRNAFGKLIVTEDVEIAGGMQLRLQYKGKAISEVGRGPAVEVPTAPAPSPQSSPGFEGMNGLADAMNNMSQSVQNTAASMQNSASSVQNHNDPWFSSLLAAVMREGFADRKVNLILSATSNHSITMSQLATLLREVPYNDDRRRLLQGVARSVSDPANVGLLHPVLPFDDERSLAHELFGG